MKIRRKLRTFESAKKLTTRSAFRSALERCNADWSRLTDQFIKEGRGHWRPNDEIAEGAKKGDELCIQYQQLAAEHSALSLQAWERWGCRSYEV